MIRSILYDVGGNIASQTSMALTSHRVCLSGGLSGNGIAREKPIAKAYGCLLACMSVVVASGI